MSLLFFRWSYGKRIAGLLSFNKNRKDSYKSQWGDQDAYGKYWVSVRVILDSIFHVTASVVYMTNSYLLLVWENSQHLATLPLVSLPNHVWETSAEIPYWWHVITHIWVVLLIGCAAWEIQFNQSEALIYPDLGRDASSVWNFCAHFSDIIWRGNQWWHCQMSAVFSG